MTGPDLPMADEKYESIFEASLPRLAVMLRVKIERDPGRRSFFFRSNGLLHRITYGAELDTSHDPHECLIMVSWGKFPKAFETNFESDVSYIDLKFGIHSRRLDEVGRELTKCLQEQGCRFKEFQEIELIQGETRV